MKQRALYVAEKIVGGEHAENSRNRVRLLSRFLNPFFFQVVNVKPVVNHPVTWNELLDVVFHVLLEFQGQIAQVQVAFFIVPSDNLTARTFFACSRIHAEISSSVAPVATNDRKSS